MLHVHTQKLCNTSSRIHTLLLNFPVLVPKRFSPQSFEWPFLCCDILMLSLYCSNTCSYILFFALIVIFDLLLYGHVVFCVL